MFDHSGINAVEAGLIPGPGRYAGEGNGNPLQYSCLGTHMDRGSWWATVHRSQERVRHDLVTKQQQDNNQKYILYIEPQTGWGSSLS